MPDTHTVTSTRSWGSRLGGSFKGILIGILMFIAAFPLLWWNEGRTQKRHLALLEAAALAIEVPSDRLDAANNGKLLYSTGLVTSTGRLQDDELQVGVEGALQFRREVEMFQWQEQASSKTEKNLGGSETTTTTYSYSRGWGSRLEDSSAFQKPVGHENPAQMDYSALQQVAEDARLGAFRLRSNEVRSLSAYQSLDLSGREFAMLDRPHQVQGTVLYLGDNPAQPQVGDLRISFSYVPAMQASIVARQDGESLLPYRTRNGSSLLLLRTGEQRMDAMFESAQSDNSLTAWLLRLAGFVLMYAGLRAIMAPLSVLGDVVPVIGTLIGMGTGIVAFLVALPLSLLTIALAWVFYRPLLAVVLLGIALACLAALWQRRSKARSGAATQPVQAG